MKASSRPLVAIVSQIPLVPVTAGNRARVLALVKELQSIGYEVIFIQIPSLDGDEYGDVLDHEQILGTGNFYVATDTSLLSRSAHYVYRKAQRAVRKAVRQARPNLDFGYQEPADFRISKAVCRNVSTIVRDRNIGTCIVEYVMHSLILNYLPKGTRKILDTHDLFSNRHREYLKDGRPYGYWISMTPEMEAKGLMRADAVLAIQTSEEADFRKMLGKAKDTTTSVKTIGHFLQIASGPLQSEVNHRLALICSDNAANREGYFLFLEKVLPIVAEALPAFRLLVAGSICSSIPDHALVDKFGTFEKIEDVFERAPAALNPVVSGSGIAIKVLEALACGVPVASTATGARGLEQFNDHGLHVSRDDDYTGFAHDIVRLTGDASWRKSESLRAYEAAKQWNDRQRAGLAGVLRA